jgi:damage-control phosphatase, subfamily II, stand-alone protein
MPILCKLADPKHYRVSDWDLLADAVGREYWIGHFTHHTDTMLAMLAAEGTDLAAMAAFKAELLADLSLLKADPGAWGPLTVLTFDQHRERLLRKHGFADPYAEVKRRENEAAIGLFHDVLAELDELDGPALIEALIRGVFAGNIFDLGSLATIRNYHEEGMDFHATRERQPARPWRVDDFDALSRRLLAPAPYRQVLFFVDNAGADLILGCVPLARHLARRGSRVVLAANSTPSLNDITWAELQGVLARLSAIDAVLADLMKRDRLATVANGCGTPLIDLSVISEACNEAARESDLIVLEGMGRSVESNHDVRFSCDVLKIALLKDVAVARRLGGTLYDQVCRFEQVGG